MKTLKNVYFSLSALRRPLGPGSVRDLAARGGRGGDGRVQTRASLRVEGWSAFGSDASGRGFGRRFRPPQVARVEVPERVRDNQRPQRGRHLNSQERKKGSGDDDDDERGSRVRLREREREREVVLWKPRGVGTLGASSSASLRFKFQIKN